MLKSIRWFLSITLLLLVCFPVAAQQAPTDPLRIQASSKDPVTLKGEVTQGREVVYVFNAKAGQKFSGRLTKKAGNTGFNVTDPEGQGLPEEEYDFNTSLTGRLEKTGDYKITVSTFENRPSSFTLVIRIH